MNGTLRYTKDHEWLHIDGNEAAVGITAYARQALGDLVYLELPKTGRILKAGECFAIVESVKAASEIYAPVSGKIAAVNTGLEGNLDALNEDVQNGWIIRLQIDSADAALSLMDENAYKTYTGTLG